MSNSLDRILRSCRSPDLLIWDDPGLHFFIARQSAGRDERMFIRRRASRFVITGNLSGGCGLGRHEDFVPGNSGLDRLANASYRIVIEGSSYRHRLSQRPVSLGAKGVIDQLTATCYKSK